MQKSNIVFYVKVSFPTQRCSCFGGRWRPERPATALTCQRPRRQGHRSRPHKAVAYLTSQAGLDSRAADQPGHNPSLVTGVRWLGWTGKAGQHYAVSPCPVHVVTDTNSLDQSILILVNMFQKDNASGSGFGTCCRTSRSLCSGHRRPWRCR